MIPRRILHRRGRTRPRRNRPPSLVVTNTGDRPIQVGSHYHFAETMPPWALTAPPPRMRL